MRPYIERNINGVDYIIAFSRETREIRYITTNDEDFRTANGLHVGSYVEVSRDEISAYPGWEIRAPRTEDGWYPVIGFVGVMTILREGREFQINVTELEPSRAVMAKVIRFSKGGN